MPKKSDIVTELKGWEQRYCDLVWYARTTPDEPLSQAVRKRVEAALSVDLEELRADDTGWQHGFNSGCLAAFRLVLGLLGSEADSEFAREEFPSLDT